jgi:hypothetical protein
MTGGSELVISAQNALTPTNTLILKHTNYGSTSNQLESDQNYFSFNVEQKDSEPYFMTTVLIH